MQGTSSSGTSKMEERKRDTAVLFSAHSAIQYETFSRVKARFLLLQTSRHCRINNFSSQLFNNMEPLIDDDPVFGIRGIKKLFRASSQKAAIFFQL